jgi:hypothetical protein
MPTNVRGLSFHKESMIFAHHKMYNSFVKGQSSHICCPWKGALQ